jgi:hypothetical protein
MSAEDVTPPQVTVIQLQAARVVDKHQKPTFTEVRAEFNTHGLSLSTVSIFYKNAGMTSFLEKKCARTSTLTYWVELPYSDSTQYYFQAIPRRGMSVRFGSGTIAGTQLGEAPQRGGAGLAAGVAGILVTFFAIGGGGAGSAGSASVQNENSGHTRLVVALAVGAAVATTVYLVLWHRRRSARKLPKTPMQTSAVPTSTTDKQPDTLGTSYFGTGNDR